MFEQDVEQCNDRGMSALHYARGALRQQLEALHDEATAQPAEVGDPTDATDSAASSKPTARQELVADDAVAAVQSSRREAEPPTELSSSAAAVLTPPLAAAAAAPAAASTSGEPLAETTAEYVPSELIVSIVRRVLRRLERGAREEAEVERLARLRSHVVAVLASLDDAGVAFTPAAAAVAARALLDAHSLNDGSDLGLVLHERLVCELQRVLTKLRRLGMEEEEAGGPCFAVTLLPVAMQLEALLPDAAQVARAEAKEGAASAAAAAAEAAAAAVAEATAAATAAATPGKQASQGDAGAASAVTAALAAAGAAASKRHAVRLAWWQQLLSGLHSALVRQIVLGSISPPPLLHECVPALHKQYLTVSVGARIHQAVELQARFMSTTKPLLLSVDWAAAASPQPSAASPQAPASPPPAPSLSPLTAPSLPTRWFYKEGDDLLQDVGTTMLLHEMNVAWAAAGAPFFTPVYAVYPLRELESAGFLECLPDAQPVSSVKAFEWSRTLHNSCVGSMVASYALGLADRHQDNMMLLGGKVFAHIDFGFVAGSRPWPFDTVRCL